ncbi:MAG: nucleoid-structuring protein H-NS, partial [Candidatus Omnitrophica bacterium]|nr:nucleoid-structuring protein H-NS [Candidatus Omnitrophota bacterium]
MYREQIKVLDCTIRDGGLINDHNFEREFVRKVYKAISLAGVDYMEIGYKNSKKLFSSKEYGLWKFCVDDEIKRLKEGV